MPKKLRARPYFISASAGANPKVIMVQKAESSGAPTSVPKVCPDEQYDPSQQVLSVLVRHTYKADPENLEEVSLENQLTNRLRRNKTRHVNVQYKCPSCERLFVNKTRYKQHVKYPCEGKYKCSSCGKQYSLKSCYEKHLKFLCEEIKKAAPKDTEKDIPFLPRLRIRKPANVKGDDAKGIQNGVEESQRDRRMPHEDFMKDHAEPVLDRGKDDTSEDESSNSHSSNTETEASDSWDTKDEARSDSLEVALFACSCGKHYKYKSWYDRHRRKGRCVDSSSRPVPTFLHLTMEMKNEAREPSVDKGRDSRYLPSSLGRHLDTLPEPGVASTGPCLEVPDPFPWVQHWVVDSVPKDQLVYCCSVPYCGQSFMEEVALRDHMEQHLDHGLQNEGPCQQHSPSILLGLEKEGAEKRRGKELLGDQAVCGTSGSCTSSESIEFHTDYLSMIQISNVMSLVTSQDEFLPISEDTARSPGKERGPDRGNTSGRRGKDVAPCASKYKQSWRSWVQRCIRKHKQKWLISGGRREVCLLCGRRFGQNSALDQHMASAHCRRFRYRCGRCNMSFKVRTCLCRHVLQAHCDLKKLKCCVCKRRYRAAHHLQRHVLKQHSGWRRQ